MKREFPTNVVWFSCGAASACVAKLAKEELGSGLQVVYCDTIQTEHPDNQRFFDEVQDWIGHPIQKIKSTRYESVDDVIEKRRFMSGPGGALCTVEMKKRPRFEFQHPLDVHFFGMTSDEARRVTRFKEQNPELRLRWILLENGLSKDDCLKMVADAGIELPAMYRLGYRNNNCLGCVKATSPAYWNKVRVDFPEVFERRVRQSRELNVKLTRVKGKRVFLDELEPENVEYVDEDLSCGPQCSPNLDGLK